MKNSVVFILVLASLLIMSCDKSYENVKPVAAEPPSGNIVSGSGNNSNYDYQTIDENGMMYNPIRVDVQAEIDTSLISDFDEMVKASIYNDENELLSSYSYAIHDTSHSHWLIWQLFDDKVREMDTIYFRLDVENVVGVKYRVDVHGRWDESDPMYVSGSANYQVIIPKRGTDEVPNKILLTKINVN